MSKVHNGINVLLDNYMLRAVLPFRSICKVCWIDNGWVGVPKCDSFRGSCLIIYLTIRLGVDPQKSFSTNQKQY